MLLEVPMACREGPGRGFPTSHGPPLVPSSSSYPVHPNEEGPGRGHQGTDCTALRLGQWTQPGSVTLGATPDHCSRAHRKGRGELQQCR